MYDNNFRIFVHLIENSPDEDINPEEDASVMFPNVAIELAFDPMDFKHFFDPASDNPPENLFTRFEEEVNKPVEETENQDLVTRFKKEIQEVS